ncbi:hypothetical protein [Glycomyces buryatensis]|uniref:Uncharacterized protein n=1 Tax=Glycomyces buryatensis TaxID=2570927 RepID=A0A4S8QET7_9ACTN|nr:hypothetical protein [Glycomyces buryatensis]THV43157.1 hypothetical protein FAB82_02700 [Glycomyces buryatensis]
MQSVPSNQRRRTAVAVVLLACATIFIAVAVSQWLFGFGLDPRDDSIRRAAGLGFTDTARQTLFSVIPLAAPALAVWLQPGRVIGRWAQVLYVAYLVIGLLLALSAARYGFDETRQLAEEGQVFIDARAAVERLLLDTVWLALAGMGLLFARRAGSRQRSSTADPADSGSPKE